MNIKEQIKKLSGEQFTGSFPKLPYAPEVKLQGDEGFFFIEERDDNGNYVKTNIESPLSLVLLRKRRRLVDMSDKGLTEISSEHDSKSDSIFLFKRRERGTAEELRIKYPDLRTQELFYALYGERVVKLVVKGSSLIRGEKKPKYSIPLYEYLQSFKNGEHVSDVYTLVIAIEEGKAKRMYFSMSFERGIAVPDKVLAKAVPFLEELGNAIDTQKTQSNPLRPESEVDLSVLDEEEKPSISDIPF